MAVFRLWSGSATCDLPRRNRFKVLAAGPAAGPEPGSNFERPGSPADSLFAADDDDDDGRASPVGDDERAADADATATSDCREGSTTTTVDVAAVVVAVADIDTGMGIGTGIDIGDWAGVFGAVLPGPAVPYRWDDMYHQKPGLAVCLYVQRSIRRSLASCHDLLLIAAGGRANLFLSSSSFASEPTVRLSLFLSFSSRGNVCRRRS